MKYHGFIILTRSVCWEDQNKLKHFRSSVFFSWCCTMFSLKANDRMYIMILYVFLEWEKKSLVEQTKMLWKNYVRISFVCIKLVRHWIPDRQKHEFLDGCAWFLFGFEIFPLFFYPCKTGGRNGREFSKIIHIQVVLEHS